jgi:hypothetical protein
MHGVINCVSWYSVTAGSCAASERCLRSAPYGNSLNENCFKEREDVSVHTPWRQVGGMEVWILSRLSLALDIGVWSTLRTGRIIPVKNAPSLWIGGWVGPRTGRDVPEKRKIVCPIGIRTSDRPVSSLITTDSLGISQQHVGFSELCFWHKTFRFLVIFPSSVCQYSERVLLLGELRVNGRGWEGHLHQYEIKIMLADLPKLLSGYNETWLLLIRYVHFNKKKLPRKKFQRNTSTERRAVPWGHTDGLTQRVLRGAFRDFANAPENVSILATRRLEQSYNRIVD